MLLPSCDFCGQCGCVCGRLPYTVTVQLSGVQDKTHSAHCALTFKSDFGSGATAVAMAPGGYNPADRGPLSEVLLLDSGCGYAKIGRVEPSIEIAGGSDRGGGTGATFTPTLALVDPEASCKSWKIESVEMEGGTDYSVDEILTVTSSGAVVVTPAVVKIASGRDEPTLKVSVSGGSGAALSVSVLSNNDHPETWRVDSVSVSDGGMGYSNGTPVTFADDGEDVTDEAASGVIATTRLQPDVEAAVLSGYGSGAELTVATAGADGWWSVSSIEVESGGSGYSLYDSVSITAVGAISNGEYIYAYVSSVGEDGEVTSVAFDGEIAWYADGGVIESVTVTGGGSYYHMTGVGSEVTVENGGEYYVEDRESPACFAAVTIDAVSCGGTGAVITPTIGSDPDDAETWGKILSLTIDDGGVDYLAWRWLVLCDSQETINTTPFVLAASTPQKIVTLEPRACFKILAATLVEYYSGFGGIKYCRWSPPTVFGRDACLKVRAVGPRSEPEIELSAAGGSGGTLTASLSDEEDGSGLPYWTISSVAASGGTGYPDSAAAVVASKSCLVVEEQAEITISANDGVLTGATVERGGKYYHRPPYDGQAGPIREVEVVDGGSGYAAPGREEPQWKIVDGDWEFTPSFGDPFEGQCGRMVWPVEAMSITKRGYTGFPNNLDPFRENNLEWNQNFFALSSEGFEKRQATASARIQTRRYQPTAYMVAATSSGYGAGAKFSYSWGSTGSQPDVTYYLTSVSPTSGGIGYLNGDSIAFTREPWSSSYRAAAGIISVNDSGAITGIQITDGGELWEQSIDPERIVVDNGGAYYRENKNLEPIVADVDVVVVQMPPSDGSGADISVVIGQDQDQEQEFGKILFATVENDGSGYQILGAPLDCIYRNEPCGPGNGGKLELELSGEKPPELRVSGLAGGCDDFAVFEGESTLPECPFEPFGLSPVYGTTVGASASVSPGGTIPTCGPSAFCCGCSFPFPEGRAPKVSGTLTLPNSDYAGDCIGGSYTFEDIEFVYYYGYYAACVNIEIVPEQVFASVVVYLFCAESGFESYPTVRGEECGAVSYDTGCTFGNGLFVYTGPEEGTPLFQHCAREIDGVSYPKEGEVATWSLPLSVVVEYTIAT